MRAPLRIAVLECDVPLPNTKTKYGGYGGVFESLLLSGAKLLNQPDKIDPATGLHISKWNVMERSEYPDLEDIDAVLLTGSKHNSYDDIPWINRLVEYVADILAQDRVRIIGVCFGHQIIGRALGLKVGRNENGWEVAVHDVDLTDKGKELFGLRKLRLQQMHRDIVHSCPSNITLLGSSPVCQVQGMYLPGRFISVQGHPEFTKDIVSEILDARKDMGVLPPGVYEGGMAAAGKEHDGVVVGKAFLEFLLEE
ncbi:GMP synthase [Paracoccidioides lutzii Pb01]|uniref:GMP synthase n=1 Tax=Paracoccidioides lutzii (strain ATCC MYA-826 / Pb01) TaxID=502779 RepID=C1GUL0_PARBA|nr:GMP synthase [Paracoccidioides lutzii Pb01]EEH40278.1 GMP synthase [Paracoccidioides lutzii Pb01]